MKELKLDEGCSYEKSVICNGTLVNIFLDDYGQSYFFQYIKDGELIERGCGTYNSEVMEQIEYELDYDSWFNKLPIEEQEFILENKRLKQERLKKK